MRQTLFLMMGYPGSGKTTTSKLICDLTGAVHVWADQERLQRFPRPRHTLQENRILYGALDKHVIQLLAQGRSVVYDANFNFAGGRRRWYKKLAGQDIQAITVWVTTTQATAYTRSQNQDGHRVFALSRSEFDRMASNLQPPGDDEQVLVISGEMVDRGQLAALLADRFPG